MSQSDRNTATEPQLLDFMSRPEAYPNKPQKVRHVQTHASHVFIAPPYVYKIKKPVNFGFLDYSSLEKRKKFCDREVELNRRLCSEVYLGVVPISETDEGYSLEPEEPDEIVEYAVKMRKLPDEYFLHTYIEKGELTNRHLDRVADKLTGFYQEQDPDKEILKWGGVEQIRYNTDENFRQTKPFVGATIDRNTYEAVKYFTNQYHQQQKKLFKRRIEQKCIIDGHGDLHLEHIHLTPERVCIYDCIEFNKRFRYGDWAADLAFLAMDLDFYDCWKESHYFVDRMADNLGDPALVRIIDFYKCYRAYIKGKVKSLQSEEEEVPEEERRQAVQKASQYFGLSLRYALLGSRPIILIFMGRVGTGKSTLARRLGKQLNIERFSSDEIRKRMAGLPLEERTPEHKRKTLYSIQKSEKTYARMYESAEEQFGEGRATILDATFSSSGHRQELARKLKDQEMDFLFVEVQAPDHIIKQRLRQRDDIEGVISDARLEDFDDLDSNYEAPDFEDKEHFISVRTDQPPEDTLKELCRKLIDRHLKKHDLVR